MRGATTEGAQNRVEYGVELLADILGQEAENDVPVLLQELIFAAVSPVRDGVSQVLNSVEFNGNLGVSAQKIDFERAEPVERDGETRVQLETVPSLRQRVETPIQERFGGASRSRSALGIGRRKPRNVHEQTGERTVDAIPDKAAYTS